jgi:hypothetical protein
LLIASTCVAVFSTAAVAQEPSTEPVEISKTDLTQLDKILATNLTVFGVALGDRAGNAEEKVRAAGFRVESEAWTRSGQVGGRFIRAFDGLNKEPFGFGEEDGIVTEIVLRSDIVPRLPGNSPKLFDASIMEAESPLRLRLLGREDRRSASGTAITTVTFSYDKEGIRLESSMARGRSLGQNVFLVAPAKAR